MALAFTLPLLTRTQYLYDLVTLFLVIWAVSPYTEQYSFLHA